MENLHLWLESSSIDVIRENSYLLALVIILVIALPLLFLFRLGIIWILRRMSRIIILFLGIILNTLSRRTNLFVKFVLLMLMHVSASLLWFVVSLLCVLKNSYPLPPYPVERRIVGK